MVPLFVIEEKLKRERERERRLEQLVLDVPLPLPLLPQNPPEDEGRGVVLIEVL